MSVALKPNITEESRGFKISVVENCVLLGTTPLHSVNSSKNFEKNKLDHRGFRFRTPEGEDTAFLINIGNLSPIKTVLYSRRTKSPIYKCITEEATALQPQHVSLVKRLEQSMENVSSSFSKQRHETTFNKFQ